MTEKDAKRIGSKQGLMSVGLGLLIIHLLIMLFTVIGEGFFRAFFWFTTAPGKWNLLAICIIMLFCGHFYGQVSGQQILMRKRNFLLVGFLYGMAVLLTTVFLTGLIGFIQRGIDKVGTGANPFEDYTFKPLIGVSVPGASMAILIGIWFAEQIKAKGRKLDTMYSTQHQLKKNKR